MSDTAEARRGPAVFEPAERVSRRAPKRDSRTQIWQHCSFPSSFPSYAYLLFYFAFFYLKATPLPPAPRLALEAGGWRLGGGGLEVCWTCERTAPAQLAGSSGGTKCGSSRELGQHRENPYRQGLFGEQIHILVLKIRNLGSKLSDLRGSCVRRKR